MHVHSSQGMIDEGSIAMKLAPDSDSAEHQAARFPAYAGLIGLRGELGIGMPDL